MTILDSPPHRSPSASSTRNCGAKPTAPIAIPPGYARRRRIVEFTLAILFPVAIFAFWQIGSVNGWWSRAFYPAPSDHLAPGARTLRQVRPVGRHLGHPLPRDLGLLLGRAVRAALRLRPRQGPHPAQDDRADAQRALHRSQDHADLAVPHHLRVQGQAASSSSSPSRCSSSCGSRCSTR